MRLFSKTLLCLFVALIGFTNTPATADTPADAGGVSGGVDLVLFKLFAASGAGGTNAAPLGGDLFHDTGLVASGRFWFGYELENGVGIRARIFEWESDEVYREVPVSHDFEIYDIEATLRSVMHEWELLGFGGVRWGSIELNPLVFLDPRPTDFDGCGITMGGEIRRGLYGNTNILAGARYSVLYGETSFRPTGNRVLEDTMMDIAEVKLGVEWTRAIGNRGQITAGAVWEHQMYGTDTYYPQRIDPETPGDVALSGPVFSLQYSR